MSIILKGNNKKELAPKYVDTIDWWTCHKDIHKGALYFFIEQLLKKISHIYQENIMRLFLFFRASLNFKK